MNARGLATIRLAFLVLAFCVFGARGALAGQDVKNLDPLKLFSQSVESLVQRVSPSVVQIVVTGYGPLEDAGRDNTDVVLGPRHSLGSGVIIDPDGYIVTNAHVVAGALRVQVALPPPASNETPVQSLLSGRGRTVDAKIIGAAKEVDLALLKIDATGLAAVRLADYDALRQGEIVFAFGSPEGLRNSVTMGLVSAVARQPDMDNPMVFIQTDAPINPGNSGGPLVNASGELVGINTFILTESGGSQGLGFAVPSAVVSVAWPQLRQYGHLHRGVIGFSLQSITTDLARALGLPRDYGVIISDVLPDGPAAAAGLRVQDVIVSVNGSRVDSYFTMFGQSYTRAPGDHLILGILRGSEVLEADVVVGKRSDDLDRLIDDVDPRTSLVRRLGVLALPVDEEVNRSMGSLRLPFGVVVIGRSQRAWTGDIPISAGDVIHTINGSDDSVGPASRRDPGRARAAQRCRAAGGARREAEVRHLRRRVIAKREADPIAGLVSTVLFASRHDLDLGPRGIERSVHHHDLADRGRADLLATARVPRTSSHIDQCRMSPAEGSCDASHPPPRAWVKETLATRRRVRMSTAAR